jgi:hypothetical protein
MQVFIIKAVVRLYFLGALAVSFSHIIEASHKLQLLGWQAFTAPFAVDGIAVIGMVMRTDRWSTNTRKIGFRVQVTAGSISLICNVFAGDTLGERIYGAVIVALFIFSEWLSDRMVTRDEELRAAEVAELEAQAQLPSPEELAAQMRSERSKKAAETRRRNARRKAREAKVLEHMLQS